MASSKQVDDVVSEVAGADVLPLVKALRNKVNVSEFKLAELIKQEINLTRNMLYRLYDNNLVSFIRKKDKKKGWYIYYWTFNQKRVKDLAGDLMRRRLEKLGERLHREKSTQFYICSNRCMRLDFEQSHDFQFKCPECGSLLDLEDNSKLVSELESDFENLKKESVASVKVSRKKPVLKAPAKKVSKRAKLKPTLKVKQKAKKAAKRKKR